MNSLEGIYKHRHQNFSLKIVRNNPNLIDLFTFIKIKAGGTELTLFDKTLQGGTPGTSYLWGGGIGINHNTDFTWISITKLPDIELNGDYDRTE